MSYQFSVDWFTGNSNNFIALQNILPENLSVLEIGSFEGLSMVWIAKNLMAKGGEIVCIDTWEGGEEHKNENVDFNNVEKRFDKNLKQLIYEHPNINVQKLKGMSNKQVPKAIADGKMFDLIYVDGSHEAADCLSDAVMCWAALKEGGVMVFDDYGWQDRPVGPLHPKPAIDTFLNFFGTKLTVLFVNYHVAIRKNT